MFNREDNTIIIQPNITAIILTYNEEKHLERCILSISQCVKRIVVIDSFSSDRTINIAKKYNVEILQNHFINQSKQLNWGLNNIEIKTDWILRIDADEFFTDQLKKKIIIELKNNNQNYDGITINRKIKFLKKKINFGGTSPHKTLRIWKTGKGYCDDAWIDEQIEVKGGVRHIDEYLIDHNLNNLSWWLNKHKNYAIKEAINYLLTKDNASNTKLSKDQSKKNKYYKINIYYKFPMFVRPFFLFFYNYVIKLGFLSSWQGFIFYFFQVLWFRFLVDVNINQIKKMMKVQKITLSEAIKIKYGYE
jgi:glycosyltransferase involved in cell wall biosynthesis